MSNQLSVGVIIPSCIRHSMQDRSWRSIRQYSRCDTPIYALLQGMEQVPLPVGVQRIDVPARFIDEADLWNWCLQFAVEKGWEWCVVAHDDFAMYQPTWEAVLASARDWRVLLAGWYVYAEWDKHANVRTRIWSPFGIILDPLAFAFRVNPFVQRGYFAHPEFGFGYSAWETNAWALSQGYATLAIPLPSDHQWNSDNTRTMVGADAPGHQAVLQRWRGRGLPARVVDNAHIEVAGTRTRIIPHGATVPPLWYA